MLTPVSTNQGLYATAKPLSGWLKIKSTLNNGESTYFECEMVPEKLRALARQGSFFSYACGVALEILTKYRVRGIEIDNYKTDLPIAKGLSSSAAICVLVARAFNRFASFSSWECDVVSRVYDLKLTIQGEMDIAYHGEITTPSRCGRMDQCCAFGNRLVEMRFDGDLVEASQLHAPALREAPLFLVLVDLHAKKDTKEILSGLSECYPFPKNEVHRGVHSLLGEINQDIISRVVEALLDPQLGAARIGELMCLAQEMFDRYAMPACPSQLTAPKLHKVLASEAVKPHIFGCKGVGSQGDGTAQFLARSASDQLKVVEILEKEFDVSCLKLTIGAGPSVRKAVIPAAGFAPSLFPASKIVKTPLFPILDRDGIMKPAILILIEEALAAGIQEIGIIVNPHDLSEFQEFFTEQLAFELLSQLPESIKGYHDKLLEYGSKIKFIVQEGSQGFGHAVLCAQDFVSNEPFLLMLGDHLYRSAESSESCCVQILEAFDGKNLIAVQVVDEGEINKIGIVRRSEGCFEATFPVSDFAEKPSSKFAIDKGFQIEGEKRFFGVFGLYVLLPSVFHVLENLIISDSSSGITPALNILRKTEGFQGFLMQGKRFDIGNPNSFLTTLSEYHK